MHSPCAPPAAVDALYEGTTVLPLPKFDRLAYEPSDDLASPYTLGIARQYVGVCIRFDEHTQLELVKHSRTCNLRRTGRSAMH